MVIIIASSWTPFGDIDLKNTFQIINATNISADNLSGNLTWNDLYGYPVACPTYSAITQLDDSVTCTDSWIHRDGDTGTGNFIFNQNFTVDTNTLFVDSDNNGVGIGTTAPDSIFHIKANVAGTVGSHPAGQLIIQDPDDTVFGNAVITGYESDGAGNPDQQLWYLGSSSSSNTNIIFLNRRNANLQLGTNGVSRLTILGNGNVGIGTATPQNPLNVIGDGNFTGNVTAENVWLPTMIFSHTNRTMAVASAGVWQNITYDQHEDIVKRRINHTWNDATNNTFTILDDGIYEIVFYMSFQDSAGTPDAHVLSRVIVNGVEVNGSLIEKDIEGAPFTNKDSILTSPPILYEFSTGDEIRAQFTSSDTTVSLITHATYGNHGTSSTISIKRVA